MSADSVTSCSPHCWHCLGLQMAQQHKLLPAPSAGHVHLILSLCISLLAMLASHLPVDLASLPARLPAACRNSCLKIEKNGCMVAQVTGVPGTRVSPKGYGQYWVDYCAGVYCTPRFL
jgi:hypothetical protein